MSELTFSPETTKVMFDAGWDYDPCLRCFTNSYYQCSDRYEIAKDISDFTAYDVSHYDTSVGKGYWCVSLNTDEQCLDFAKRYSEYENARQRIANALFNGVLLLTKEQHDKIAAMVERYDKRFVGDQVLIAIPENEFTRHVVTILDALGI